MTHLVSGQPPVERRAEAIFCALETLDALVPTVPGTGTQGAGGFAELYRYATVPDADMSAELGAALAGSARLRDDLRYLLAREAALSLPAQAAASSATVTTRRGTAFSITLRESLADRDQVYVIIQIGDPVRPAPRTLFVIEEDRACHKTALPQSSGGTIQLLLDAESDLVASLRDPKTAVFLR